MGRTKRPAAFYAALAVGGVVLVVGGGFYLRTLSASYRHRNSMIEQAKAEDPQPAIARKMLGVEQLPQGYSAYVKPGWLLLLRRDYFMGRDDDTNIRSDTFGFVFLLGPKDPRAARWAESIRHQLNQADGLNAGPLQVKPGGERLGSGSFQSGGASVQYVTWRGDLSIDRVTYRGLSALLFIECPGPQGTRVAAWFTPDPRSGTRTGTAADEQALRAFLHPLSLCEAA
jgi:hypothetical protein